MRTIAIVTPSMHIGGAEQYTAVKCDWLNKHGYQTIVIYGEGDNVGIIPQKTKIHKIDNLQKAPYAIDGKETKRIVNQLSQIIENDKIDIIEAHNSWPLWYIYESCNNTPYLFNILNEHYIDKNLILKRLTANASREGHLCTLTESMNEYISNRCNRPLKSKIIHLPVIYQERESISKNYILSVCRLDPDKKYIEHLIDGYFLSASKQPSSVDLVIVGDGALYNNLLYKSEQYNRILGRDAIKLYGIVTGDALQKLYSECALYVGMGTTLINAAFYGKPCILAGWDNNSEFAWGYWGAEPDYNSEEIVYSGYGRKQYSYEQIITNSLTDSIKMHLIGERARQLARKCYDIDDIMNEWVLFYNKLSSGTNTSKYQRPFFTNFLIKPLISLYRILYHPIKFLKRYTDGKNNACFRNSARGHKDGSAGQGVSETSR